MRYPRMTAIRVLGEIPEERGTLYWNEICANIVVGNRVATIRSDGTMSLTVNRDRPTKWIPFDQDTAAAYLRGESK